MFRSVLFAALLDRTGTPMIKYKPDPLLPSTPVAFFIEKGHIAEILFIQKPVKKIAILFFGPGEFAIRCHPLTELVGLDTVKGNPFTHGDIFKTLRKFPEIHQHYRELSRRYQDKVNDRVNSLQTMNDQQRFAHLKATQPWVLQLAEPDAIASYLFISRQLLQELSSKK